MIPTEAALNAYIDANIVLVFAFLIWMPVRLAMSRLGFRHSYVAQLKLMNWIFAAMAAGGLAVVIHPILMRSGLTVTAPFNFSDFAVAQYLDGRLGMKPSEFERMLTLRETAIRDFLSFASTTSLVIWGALIGGAMYFAGRLAVSALRLRATLKASFEWRRFGRVQLLLSDHVKVPFSTRGLRRRYVVIPSGMLANASDLKIVIGHELQHFRQGDIEWEFLLECLRPLFFWNPVFLIWKGQVERLRELACDQQLLATQRFDLRAYCDCLMRVCHDSLRHRGGGVVALPSVPLVQTQWRLLGPSSAAFLRQRFVSLMDTTGRRVPGFNAPLAALPIAVLVVAAALAIQKPGDWSQDRLMLSAIVNLERLNALNETGQK